MEIATILAFFWGFCFFILKKKWFPNLMLPPAKKKKFLHVHKIFCGKFRSSRGKVDFKFLINN